MPIPRVMTEFVDKETPPGAAHTAQIEAIVADQTEGLVYRNMGNTRAFAWIDPATAPYASLTSSSTMSSFTVGDATGDDGCTFQIWPKHLLAGSVKAVAID